MISAVVWRTFIVVKETIIFVFVRYGVVHWRRNSSLWTYITLKIICEEGPVEKVPNFPHFFGRPIFSLNVQMRNWLRMRNFDGIGVVIN